MAGDLENTTGTADTDWAAWIRERTEPADVYKRPEALDDLRVVDVSSGSMAGAFCSSILAEWGAEVVRVEPPGGDVLRQFSPFGLEHGGTGLAYLVEGRNKFHITCNLQKKEGRDLLARLAARADALIETFTPGRMDRWGIGYRQLAERNPRLVYAALSTYGQFGPKARRNAAKPDYDVADQALSGLAYITGEPAADPKNPQPYETPTKAGNWMGWYAQGAWAAFGILAAVNHRRASGRGQCVDVSGAEAVMRFCEDMVTWYEKGQYVRPRLGVMDTAVSPYNFLRCKDGYQMLAGFSDVNFQALTTIIGRPELREDPRFKTFVKRAENRQALHHELERWTIQYTSQEILDKVQDYVLNKRGPGIVATGRVNSPAETFAEGHWWERGSLMTVEDPVYGELPMQGQPWKATGTPPRMKWACRSPGADNAHIYLRHLGIGRRALAALHKRGVV
ncbi:MAG TPA: CoA transferase [Candidatus Sulfotelmatobacter sp.]|nr:CoA transferase [Candidatus Sulfotelmatobacter sp.]